MEGACPGRATPTNWRCGRAARQLSAPHPGHTQTLPSGNHFCARHGGDRARGCGGCKGRGGAAAGAYGRRMRCAATFRTNLGAEVHATWLHRADAEQNLFTRDARAERCGQRTRGMRGCSCAERACACGPGARAQRRALRLGRTRLPRRASFEFCKRARCRFKRRGEGYCSRTPGTNRKAVGLETCRVNPSHTNLLHHLSQKLFFLLVLLVQCLLWGAIHVNKLPRPSSHY